MPLRQEAQAEQLWTEEYKASEKARTREVHPARLDPNPPPQPQPQPQPEPKPMPKPQPQPQPQPQP